MDPRLRTAVDASVGWYDAVFAAHGVAATLDDGLYCSVGAPPPLHSAVKTVEPGIGVDRVRRAVESGGPGAVADCFADLDLADGFDLLFTATWIHLPPGPGGPMPAGWSVVRDPAVLAQWHTDWDTDGPLVPALLGRGSFVFLLRREGPRPTTGAVAHLGTGAAYLSNVHGIGGTAPDWPGLVAAVRACLPGRALVGYERGDDLGAALAEGFTPVGDHRVWVPRPGVRS